MAYTNLGGQVRVGVRPVVTAQQLQTATYLLDTYSGAAAAYSLRKLNSSYSGSAVRVRRSIDNLEQNIVFDGSGNLDTSGLQSFVNSSDTSTSKLLDQYSGASVAYSLRKLSATYSGSSIRVRRSSDNQEMNIGFNVSGNLDTTTLLSFVGVGNGFVTTWYDQSSNNNHATQNVSNLQPQIVSNGSILLINNKPSISFDNNLLNLSSLISLNNYSYHSFVGSRASTSDKLYGLSGQNGYKYVLTLWSDNKYYLQAKTNVYQVSNSTDNTIGQILLTGRNINGVMSIYKNSNIVSSSEIFDGNINPSITGIGQYYNSLNSSKCSLQEIVFYNNNQTSQVNIESNMNYYYSIYSQSNNGFVTTWYDQSGNGRNVTQTTSANQPQIVSNGSVILRNGKPAIDFTSGQILRAESRVIGIDSTSVFNVFSVKSLTNRSVPWDIGKNDTSYHFYALDVNTWQTSGQKFGFYTSTNAFDTNIPTNLSQNLVSIISNNSVGTTITTNTTYHMNDKLATLPSSTAQYANFTTAPRITFGDFNGAYSVGFAGTHQEFIAYQSNKLSDRSLITNNINTYYSIWDSSIVQSGLVMNLDPSFKSSYSGTGSTWTDISYNGSNGTLTNGPSFATASGGQITFDGVNDFVKVPLNLSSYSQITVEIWYKMNPGGSNLSTWGGMLWEHSSDWNSNQGGFGLAVNSGGCSPDLNLMHTNHNGGSGAMNYQYYSGTTWSCHVNIFSRVSDPTGRLAYVNGQLVPFTLTNTCSGVAFSSSTATSASYSPFRNDFLYMASRNGTSGFINTNIGLIRVYSRKLSASEIQQNFNATKSRFGL